MTLFLQKNFEKDAQSENIKFTKLEFARLEYDTSNAASVQATLIRKGGKKIFFVTRKENMSIL